MIPWRVASAHDLHSLSLSDIIDEHSMTTTTGSSTKLPNSSDNGSVEFVQLKGHSGSVLCLDHSNSADDRFGTNNTSSSGACIYDSTLLSGSEDGTCRLWDLRTGLRASLCIQCYSNSTLNILKTTTTTNDDCRDVLSVSFGPPWQQQEALDMNAESSFARDYSVYAAVGSNVFGYDLRFTKSPIISVPSNDFSFLDCTDEINQIMFSPNTSASISAVTNTKVKQRGSTQNIANSHRPSYLFATADDSGTVRLSGSMEKESEKNDRAHERNIYVHDETALVTSIAFRPQLHRSNGKNKRQTSVLLASGGTDCCIRLWDVGDCCRLPNNTTTNSPSSSSSSLPLSSISIPQTTSSESNQVCNPPMVHCLQWSPSGQLLAAGLGDGSVAMMNHPTSSAPLILSSRIEDAHSGTVAACLFPAWTNKHCNSNAIAANDRFLCTTGNDGCIAFWDLGEIIGGEKANNPTNLFPLQNDIDDHQQDMNANISSTKVSKSKVPTTNCIDVPETLFAFQHQTKPNWMIHSGNKDTSFPYSLFVADTSNIITAYTIPIR